MAFNEDTRVKIPAILHFCGLGYEYISLKNAVRDESTNIFTDIFDKSITCINSHNKEFDIKKLKDDIQLALDSEDLGESFYKLLTKTSGDRLIDFKNFDNNSFHVCTELTYKNGDEEFRPDVILLINGMPLAFVEVKKPNNQRGVLVERERINTRFKNPKFKKFVNISQLLVFTNNMEYDTESVDPIQGAFYASTSYEDVNFNCFREEKGEELASVHKPIEDDIENFVLKDNNLSSIKHSPEFITNKNLDTPTNRILTSLFSKERLKMLLKYGITYVKTSNGLEKHIMRYPQFFATKAIERKLKKGETRGIIWHTQGSGKTALAYFNVPYLTDYFRKDGVVPRFYFIVDRIDLMEQAKGEFSSRGLIVHTVNSKDELLEDFREGKAISNLSGQQEITVVNIQKFKDDSDVLQSNSYDINVQRIYFLDEVHRSYNPQGSFLANLLSSDRKAIIIGLTGTPLIGKDRKSRDTFGGYIHKYYYNASIADGYTLRLIREGIETSYRLQLEEALKQIELLQGSTNKRVVYSHEKFVKPMLEYILADFKDSRIRMGSRTIGGMVVCDSSDQAKKMYELFEEIMIDEVGDEKLTAALILHDVDTKTIRKEKRESFKNGKIDLLFVYNMLLTGFDAKRLKKLYLGRVIRNHNLLQTLTRVNRPYQKFRYGYVVDFADIRQEFDKTNKAYFEELQNELGDEIDTYSNLFKSKEEIEEEIENIKDTLFNYDLVNSEVFSQQISQIEDKKTILEIRKALQQVRNLYNLIRLHGHYELLKKIDFHKLNQLYNETARHLNLINLKESIRDSADNTNLLNQALEDTLFVFQKVSEEELVIADQLKDILRKTREALNANFDKKDPQFTTLYEELKRLFKKKNLDEISQEEMKNNINSLEQIYNRITELNRKNNLLKTRYDNDSKYARLHKRIIERENITKRERDLVKILRNIKEQADKKVLINNNILNNEGYFESLMTQTVVNNFEKSQVALDAQSAIFINQCVSREYVNEFRGNQQW